MQQLQQALPSHTYALLRIVVITQHAVQWRHVRAKRSFKLRGHQRGHCLEGRTVYWTGDLRDQCFGMLCRLSVGHVSRGHYTDQAWEASRWWWLLGGSVRPVRLSGVVENVAVDLKKKRG